MRINGYYNYNQQKNYAAYANAAVFKAKTAKAAEITGDLLSLQAQAGIERIHKNLAEIKELFLLISHYPAKAVAIKEGYPGLLQKNRNQGLSFALPDNRGTVIVRQLRAETDMLRFAVEDNGEQKNLYTKGYARVVANINPNNPHFLPRRFRYMTKEEINNSNIEEYIKVTDEELTKYNEYLTQFRDPVKRREVSVAGRKVAKAVSSVPTIKENIKKMNEIFAKTQNDFSEDVKLQTASNGNMLGLGYTAEDGAVIKVTKVTNVQYRNNVIYLKFSRQYPDGRKSFMAVDLMTQKFLRLKDDGKPYIRNDILYEYTDEEVKKRSMNSKLSDYVSDIYKKLKQKENPETLTEKVKATKVQKKKDKPKTEIEPSKIAIAEKPEINSPIPAEEIQDTNFEKMKVMTVEKAKKDAQTLADIYFKTFTETFNELIMKKFSDFKADIERIFVKE